MTVEPGDPQRQPDAKGDVRPRVHPRTQPLRIMPMAMMSALVVIGVVLSFISASATFNAKVAVAGLAMVVIAGLVINVMGFNTKPLPVAADENDALAAFQAGMIIRATIAEVPALATFAMAIAYEADVLSYLPAALGSLALFVLFVLPRPHTLRRVERALDRDGARSQLSALFGYAPH